MNFTAYPLESIDLVRVYSELPSMSVSDYSVYTRSVHIS